MRRLISQAPRKRRRSLQSEATSSDANNNPPSSPDIPSPAGSDEYGLSPPADHDIQLRVVPPSSFDKTHDGLCEYCQRISIADIGLENLPHAPDSETLTENAKFCLLCRRLRHLDWRRRGGHRIESPSLGPLSYDLKNDAFGTTRLGIWRLEFRSGEGEDELVTYDMPVFLPTDGKIPKPTNRTAGNLPTVLGAN